MNTTPNTRLRFVLPIRTSKRKKDAKSPQQQTDLANAWANAHGHEIATVLDSGRDESGKTMDRQTIRAAMEMVRTGQADGIVFALTDRLGRAPIEESMAWIRQLNLIGYLALADAGGDPVNLHEPNAESMLVFQLQMARQYWLASARRFRQSQRDAVKAGKYIGKAPLGYARRNGRLHKDPATWRIVREAFLRAGRHGIHDAMGFLQAKLPKRHWTTSSTRRVLSSRVYLGWSLYRLEADPVNFPEAEELLNRNAHDVIVDQAEWDDAQTDAQPRRDNLGYLLSQIATCKACGAALVGAAQTVDGRTYRRYRCAETCKGGVGSVSADRLEGYVREEVAVKFTDDAFRLSLDPVGKEKAEKALNGADRHLARTIETANRARTRRAQEHANREVDAAELAYEQAELRLREIAARSSRVEQLPGPEEIRTSDRKLLRAIRAANATITVSGGRAPIEVRVDIVAGGDDLDNRARVLAA